MPWAARTGNIDAVLLALNLSDSRGLTFPAHPAQATQIPWS
jgi:hypothetical protein